MDEQQIRIIQKANESLQKSGIMKCFQSDEYKQMQKKLANLSKSGYLDAMKKISESGALNSLQIISTINNFNNNVFDIYQANYAKIFDSLPKIAKEKIINNPIVAVDRIIEEKNNVAIQELFSDITREMADEFQKFIVKFPMLGFHNETGKKIFKELKNKIKSKIVEEKNKTFYRIRLWEKDQSSSFHEREMFQPAYGKDITGRFSCFGLNFLYMSSELSTCEKEIKNENGKKNVLSATLERGFVFDMTDSENIIFEYCNHKKSDSSVKEYIFPNFFAECCILAAKELNIKLDGIKYKSSLVENGINYVFFNFEYGNFINIEVK